MANERQGTRFQAGEMEYDYEIVYKKGSLNVVADALSRIQPELNVLEDASEMATNGETIYSAGEDLQLGFPISEKPLNEYNIQMVIQKGIVGRIDKRVPFMNKLRITWTENCFDEETIGRRLKQILKPKRTVALLIPENLVIVIQNVYCKYFAYSKLYRAIRCTVLLPDIKEKNEQEQVIKEYHE